VVATCIINWYKPNNTLESDMVMWYLHAILKYCSVLDEPCTRPDCGKMRSDKAASELELSQ